jgi:hypothetical protein
VVGGVGGGEGGGSGGGEGKSGCGARPHSAGLGLGLGLGLVWGVFRRSPVLLWSQNGTHVALIMLNHSPKTCSITVVS